MQVLTPSGYVSPAALANGAAVCAFDADNSGDAIVNTIENIDFVDYAEWCRWWQLEDAIPAFTWYRVNSKYLLFREQSVWRNGINVCHARDLVVGDEIYDDADRPVTITSIEVVEDESLVWYRFDISGDHSYIVDGLTLHNASRFWVSGTGTWDSSTTTHWAASSGGTGGQTVPGSADTVTLDGSSGGGTVTLNFGGSITLQSITMGAFTGTFDNSVNNNNMTLSAGTGFSGTGTGARTIKLGTATYTLSANGANWAFATTTNLTYAGNTSANIVFSGASSSRTFAAGGLSHGNVTFGASSGPGTYTISGGGTLASLSISAPNILLFSTSTTITVTAALSWNGTSSSPISIFPTVLGVSSNPTIAAAGGSVMTWCAFYGVTFTGSPTATDSFDLLNNSGISITGPSGGGGSGSGPSFSATIF